MRSAVLAKTALCICPPAVVATTAATVPPVRHAVHRFTAAYEPHQKHAAPAAPCVPVDRKTFASLLPTDVGPVELTPEPSAFSALTPESPGALNVPPVPQQPIGPGVITQPNGGGAPGVPEPGVWLTMVVGFGMIGAGFRQQRRYVIRSRKLALASGVDGGAGSRGPVSGMGGLLALGATVIPVGLSPLRAGTRLAEMGSKAMHSSFLAKAAMCVCPTVGMALGTAAVPPVRHAVYNATKPLAPYAPTAPRATVAEGIPCVPVDVPTAAEAVQQGGDKLAVLESAPNWPS